MGASIDVITADQFEQYGSLIQQRNAAKDAIPRVGDIGHSVTTIAGGLAVLGSGNKILYAAGGLALICALYREIMDRRGHIDLYNQLEAQLADMLNTMNVAPKTQ